MRGIGPGGFRGRGRPLDVQGRPIPSRTRELQDTGPDALPTELSLQVPPPWQFPPPGAREFFTQATGVLAAGAGQVLDLADLSLNAPDRYKGVIRTVGIFIDAPLATFDITWIVLVNGAPYSGWDTLTTFPRAANSLSVDLEGVIRLPQNAQSTIRIRNNNAVGPWTVGANYSGWWWPLQYELAVYGREM